MADSLLILLPLLGTLRPPRLPTPPAEPAGHQPPTQLIAALLVAALLLALPLPHTLTGWPARVPFTDERGYRRPAGQPAQQLALAVGLPLLLAAALAIHSGSGSGSGSAPAAHHHLMDIWNASPQLAHAGPTLRYSQADYLRVLARARLDLLAFTTLNLCALLLDILLARLADRWLPVSNNALRLVAATAKSLLVAILFSAALALGWWGPAVAQSMSVFECLFSVFTFQSCLYLTTRLARRAFTLAESSVFSSISVALMIEVIRLTSARLRYSAFLRTQRASPGPPAPLSDADRLSFLPGLFRFPTPAIAIQHVLVSGIFLMAFTLAPLLVLSRRLGQRPTKRTRPSTRSLSRHPASHRHRSSPTRPAPPPQTIQKPIWTSEPAQPDYYQRFSNPDAQHHSRQHESALKENLRKVIALSIYASILWIGLVVMSHWLGWLFEIGRDRRVQQAWWRRILGPGWLAFFCYSFLRYPHSLHPADLSVLGIGLLPGEKNPVTTTTTTTTGIRWTRIAMLVYWWICLVAAIGGWTSYLVRKRRSLRNSHRIPSEIGTLAGWRSSWKKSRLGSLTRSRSRSRARSGSPTAAAAPPVVTSSAPSSNITLASSLRYIADALCSPRQPPRASEPVDPPSAPATKCRPSHLVGKVSLLVRRTFSEPQPDTVRQRSSPPTDLLSTRPTSPSAIASPKPTLPTTPSLSAASPSPPPLHPQTLSGPGSLLGSTKSQHLNFKRKFFHLLVCFMFLPTIPIDIEFSSISFSVAFVIFTFCEFARYFAFYPIGAAIHLFFNEFIDEKDSGPVILSHFYLLTACSTGIWLDGLGPLSRGPEANMGGSVEGGGRMAGLLPVPLARLLSPAEAIRAAGVGCSIEDLIGVIVLGVGDSCASIVGKRVGRVKWSAGSSKTVEGSLAFVASVVAVSLLLRLVGLVYPFPFFRYLLGIVLAALLEAVTAQNDNLVLPLYTWSILKLLFRSP
ncbi:hypothetical protein PTTG_07309 [Puccinia triticina 1-1 BBBD Race 1]|uniref:dolichol kinase n=1 Tax=Puccinia triticina (isolate 1-1 / race 1 (BBBD)) TaxID=630390 RepID=A0A180GZB0_PUCT1|nr:hypothetical protein PTTG_07309 [Puccinia triticina 1-1 BBBD Race 1]